MPSIPVLSSLTEVLVGAVSDDFKKLIKPGPLVAAAIFLALNQVLILPSLRQHKIAFLLAFESLSMTWQVLLGTFILFVFGYLLSASGNTFINLISGQSIKDTSLGRNGIARQERIYEKLMQDLTNYALDDSPDEAIETAAARATQRLATDFPEHAALAPTQLGNILSNPASYTWNQYGVHLDTVWPVMETVLRADGNEALQKSIAGRMDALSFLASLAGVSGLVGSEILLLRLWWGPVWHLLWLPVLGLFAYIAYATAVPQARAWGRDMRLAFDLHLDAVAARLKLRPLDKYEDFVLPDSEWTRRAESERMARWQAVSRWLLYGALQLPAEDWVHKLAMPRREAAWYYEKPAPATSSVDVTLIHPPTVSVTYQQQRLPDWQLHNNNTARLAACRIAYLFGITNEESGQHAAPAHNVFLLVGDKRVPSVPAAIIGRLNQAGIFLQGIRQPGPPDRLFWALGDIPPRTTIWLRYEVVYDPRLQVQVENTTLLDVKPGDDSVTLLFRRGNTQDVNVIATRLNEDQALPRQLVGVSSASEVVLPATLESADASHVRWKLGEMPADDVVRCVLYPAKIADEES